MRGLAHQALSWAFACAIIAFGVINHEALKIVAADALGMTLSAAGADDDQSAARTKSLTKQTKPDDWKITQASARSADVEIRRGENGHFETTAYLNGRAIDVLVDTGASTIALSDEDARRAGVYMRPSDFTSYVSTANGRARVAPVMLSTVSIGSITVRNVQALVGEPGALTKSLLGMTFLNRLAKVEFSNGLLSLKQ